MSTTKARGKRGNLTEEERMLEEIKGLIKDSQDARERKQKRETIKLKTPYGLYSKSANTINKSNDTRSAVEIHESRRRLYHSHEDLKGDTINLAAVDHQLRKYAFDMGEDYHKLDEIERGKKKTLERFIPSMTKVDAYVELSKSQSLASASVPSSSASVAAGRRKNGPSPTKTISPTKQRNNSNTSNKPPPPPGTPQQSLADLAGTTSGTANKKVNFHITANRLKRKYPQYCESLIFSDIDVKKVSCKRDYWIVKFMEICYDEALEAFGNSTTHGKKRLHHGLDIGGLESFPSLVQRIIAKQFSTLEIRLTTSLEVLYTIEYLIQVAEVSRYKMQFDELKTIFDGGRALLFSRFLTEEYDVDVLAAFLYCRELVQKELGHKFKDVNPTRIKLDERLLELKPTFNTLLEQNKTLTAFASSSTKTPTKLSKLITRLPPRSNNDKSVALSSTASSSTVLPSPPIPSLPASTSHSLSISKNISTSNSKYKLAPEFQQPEESAPLLVGDEGKVVPIKLPEKWSYVEDISLPETPLVAFENSNLMHLCFVISSKSEESARQYLCRRIKDVAVQDMLREGSLDSKADALTHIHVYALLRGICAEWKKISAEDKRQFTDSGDLITNLTSLNEIYDNNCQLIKSTAEQVILKEGEVSLATARMLRLMKQVKREEKRFQSRIAGDEDLEKLSQLREELTIATLEKNDCEENLLHMKKEKEKLQVTVEKLWTNIMEQNRTMKYDVSAGASSFWKQFVSFMLQNTLKENAHNHQMVQQSMAAAKNNVQAALKKTLPAAPTTAAAVSSSPKIVESKEPTAAEIRFSLIEVLARIVARTAINDGKRKYLLRDFLLQKRYDLLLKYGDEDARRQQDERLLKARLERLRQEKLRMTTFFVKAMVPSLVAQFVDDGKMKAVQALYDPWWMLDLDPIKFVPYPVLMRTDTLYQQARLRQRRSLLRILYRVLARSVYERRIAVAHTRWTAWRALRKWHQLFALHARAKALTCRVQKLVRCFLWKCRNYRHFQRVQRNNDLADIQRRHFQVYRRYPRMVRYWHEYASLKHRYRDTRLALKERRFLICFYTWLNEFKKLRRAQMQQSQLHQAKAQMIIQLIRLFLSKRRVTKKRAMKRLADFARYAFARQRLLQLRLSRRREAEIAGYVLYRQQKFTEQRVWRVWFTAQQRLAGGAKLASAYVHDKLRKRFRTWLHFTQQRNAYLGVFVTKIQSLFHMAVVFRRYWHFYRWRRALVKLQGLVRRKQAMIRFAYDIYYYRQAKTIQRYARGFIVRKTIDTRRLGDVMYAAAHNKYERLKFYVDHRPDLVSKVDKEGNTALHFAAQHAARRTLKLLMRFGLQPNMLNYAGFSPLHLLILSSAIHRDECFLYMIDRGFDDDQLTSTGKTCLLLACEMGHVVIVKRLLDDGHDTNVSDETGFTCLQAACAAGSAPVVQALLENDAEVHRAGRNGTYAIHEAISSGSLDVLNWLLTHEAEVNVTEPHYQQTPLMWAAQLGHAHLARQLILYGAEVNARDHEGKTAAHYAAMTNTTDIYHALREAEADFEITDNEGNTPLHMAAYYNAFSFATEVLQGGVYPSFQNDQGDQCAHIAARYNQLDMLKVVAQYDEHIGRCNYAHQTPLGVAKFYNAVACQQFLEQHYFMVESVDGRNAVGEIWWDKEIDAQLLDWDVQVQPNGDRFYVHRKTGAVSDRPPAMPAKTVKTIAQKAELPVQRAITLVKEGTALTKHAYYLEYEAQKAEIKDMNKEYRNATIITKFARRKLAYLELKRLKAQKQRNKVILRFLKRHLVGFMAYRTALKTVAVVRIQAAWRGYAARKHYFAPVTGPYWSMRLALAKRRLRYDFWALYQAYKRKMAFRALLLIAKMPRTLSDWAIILDKAKKPIRTVGAYEEWPYPGQRNVFFYRHALTGTCEFLKPLKLIVHDDLATAEAVQMKKFGATFRQIALAVKLQALWRGYMVRHYSQSVEKALRISQAAEAKYLAHPDHDTNVYNFALYTLTFRQDIDRARRLFVESLRRMQWRGPDIAFVLYAYAIFGMLSDDEDYTDVKAIIARAQAAEDYRDSLVRRKFQQEEDAMNYDYVPPANNSASNNNNSQDKKQAQKKKQMKMKKKKSKDEQKNKDMMSLLLTDTGINNSDDDSDEDDEDKKRHRYGRCFELAHVGFFRYTATTISNAMAWEAYALCRFLIYNDFKTSFDAFLEAFKYEPKNVRIRTHYEVMMTHFFGNNKELHHEMTKLRLRQHAQDDANREEARRIFRDAAKLRWNSASKIKRWYKECRQQRIFQAFLTMVREKIRRINLQNQRQGSPSRNNNTRRS